MKKNLLTSLKELLEALGGEKSNQTNIVGVVDEITEQVNNNKEDKDSSSSDASGNIYLDIDKLSKPTIDNMEYDGVYAYFKSTQKVVPALILDVESIEQLPPMLLMTIQDNNTGRTTACQYVPVTYEINLVHGKQQSQFDTLEGEDYVPWLVGDTDIECCAVYYIIPDASSVLLAVLFPSSAQFGLLPEEIIT